MWIKPQGYSEIITPTEDVVNLDRLRRERIGAGTAKYDTCTCAHCNAVFHISAGMRPEDLGGMCSQCWKIICPRCLDKPCIPWEKQLEEMERAIERHRIVSEYIR